MSVRRTRDFALLAVCVAVLGACSDKVPPEASWARVDPPVVEAETDDVTVINGKLEDGRYWATVAPVSGSGEIVFRVVKVRFGDACEAWAKERGLEFCANDYAVEEFPDAYVALDELAEVTVSKADGPGTNYSVNGDTLKGLVRGDIDNATEGYVWTPFPFVATVTNGFVTSAEQYWVP